MARIEDNWDDHWEKQNDFADYNPGQKLRHNLVYSVIGSLDFIPKVLFDFGSGQGDLIRRLSSRFSRIKMVGLEYSSVGVQISQKNNPGSSFYQADLTSDDDMSKFSSEADVITCCDVLEHIDDHGQVVRNAYKALTQGGVLIITVPGGPMTDLDHYIGHRRHYSKMDLEALLKNAGFSQIKVSAVGWPFFNLYRLLLILRGSSLIKDVSGKGDGVKNKLIMFVGTIFSLLFKFNINKFGLGWQMLAVAKKV